MRYGNSITRGNTPVGVLPNLTHWGRETHIYVGKLTISGSDKGLSPGRRQAIIWTNARLLLIWHLETNFSEILIEIKTFSLKKSMWNVVWKMSAILSRPHCVYSMFQYIVRRFQEWCYVYWPRIPLMFVTRLSVFPCHLYMLIFMYLLPQ